MGLCGKGCIGVSGHSLLLQSNLAPVTAGSVKGASHMEATYCSDPVIVNPVVAARLWRLSVVPWGLVLGTVFR